MQQKIVLYLETDTKEKLVYQVYITDDTHMTLTTLNGKLQSAAAVRDNMPWESIAQDLIDYALTVDTPEYVYDRLKRLGLDDEQLDDLGFEDYSEGE